MKYEDKERDITIEQLLAQTSGIPEISLKKIVTLNSTIVLKISLILQKENV